VGRAPSYLSNVLYVDRGSASGIRVDSPALSGDGVIGRVILTSPHNSQVQLITNADASIGVMVERTRSPGVLKGSGNDLLSLNYISNTEQIEVGDMVVSSGLDGIYPKGLPVGRIVESYKGKSVFRVIQVAPQADLMRIEEVLILPGPSKRE
jgi:rod shape-determining protein MreC